MALLSGLDPNQGLYVATQVNSPALGQSLARLRAALGGLESAADRRLKAAGSTDTLAAELALMQDDRARLAGELDAAMARAERLAQANREVDKRLTTVTRSIKKVLGDEKSTEKPASSEGHPSDNPASVSLA